MTNGTKIRHLDDTDLAEFILSLLKGEGEPDGYEYHCENCPAWNCTNIEPEEQCCFATAMIWLGEESEMSKMKEVAEILGVDIGKEFRATGIDNDYRITDSRFEAISLLNGEWVEAPANVLYELLTGKRKIIKKPWKPKRDDKYFVAYSQYCFGCIWCDSVSDQMFYAIGNCFRTQEEAEKHKDEVLAKLKEVYDSGKPLIGADECQS